MKVTASRTLQAFLLLALVFAAYAPVFDNGFIADDWDNRGFAREFRHDLGFLFTVPPQNFRMTTFVFLSAGEIVFGNQSAFYYAIPILIHFLNCLLLWKLLSLLDRKGPEAYLAACLFAVFQAPQEAMMWLSAIAETMLGTSILAILILWIQGRRFACMGIYVVALFTKESAPIVLLLVPLVDWIRGERVWNWRYLWFAPPTLGFGVLFWWVSTNNPMIQQGLYEFGIHGAGVLLGSLHRLVWPWLYILVAAYRTFSGRWMPAPPAARLLLILPTAMLPYIWVTYTTALPSRHVYLASFGLAALMALLLWRIPSSRFRQAFVAVFIAFNIFYLWSRKDPQFEERAIPTTALLEVLEATPPQPVMIVGFAYPYPSIARSVGEFAPGWNRSLIGVEGASPPCDCLRLTWNRDESRYVPGR